jgi:hypothetical protein
VLGEEGRRHSSIAAFVAQNSCVRYAQRRRYGLGGQTSSSPRLAKLASGVIQVAAQRPCRTSKPLLPVGHRPMLTRSAYVVATSRLFTTCSDRPRIRSNPLGIGPHPFESGLFDHSACKNDGFRAYRRARRKLCGRCEHLMYIWRPGRPKGRVRPDPRRRGRWRGSRGPGRSRIRWSRGAG